MGPEPTTTLLPAGRSPPIQDQRMSAPDADELPQLRATVVRYADGPDRVTLHPETADELTLMTTWLSADVNLLHSLEAWR